MRSRFRHGFTLIELLTVIAIIAVLAALAFPVFSRVREGARQSTCMSNLHDLYVAANLYRQDQGEWPTMLLGPAEGTDGLPYLAGVSTLAGPADRMRHSFLLPYVKDISRFHCPDNPAGDQSALTTATYSPNSGWTGTAAFGSAGFDWVNAPQAYAGQPITFYAYDSYDISAGIGPDGVRLTGPDAYQVVFAKNWTAAEAHGVDTRQDAPNQMMYRDPPRDKTVLTWCNYHVAVAGGNRCPVILLSGSAKTADYKQIVQKGWNLVGAP